MTSALLVITTGQTDAQLVSEEARWEFRKDRCATLHDELERRASEWMIVDAPVTKAHGEISDLPSSPFQICTPKLDAVLNYLSDERVMITHALVLETRRNSIVAPADPRFAGAILEKRLRELREVAVWRRALLEDGDRLEDRSDARDAVIRRDVVARIDGAVRAAIQNSAPQRIVVAATGGMPTVAMLVEEVVRLHAGSGFPVDFVEIADGAMACPPTGDRATTRRSVPEPAESFRARRHALELIERGNLLAAWGAVRHLEEDEDERRWTAVVEWLYRFAASLPIPNECNIHLLTHERMAVRAAIRVDLALRSEDVPRAVHSTVAFFEAALWDHLLSKCVKHHPTNRRLFQFQPAPPESLIRSAAVSEDKNRKCPFDPKTENGETWYSVFDDDVCAIRLAKHYLRNDGLQTLGQAISQVRELRNDVAHNEPTPELMADARDRMADADLWSKDDRFLTQPLVQKVLTDLGEEQPERLCESLIATVRSRLLAAVR